MIKAIIYDCVGPLLLRNPLISFDARISEVDKLCGGVINEEEFWNNITQKYNWNKSKINEVVGIIANGYQLNKPMMEFHETVKLHYKTGIINNGTYLIFDLWTQKFLFDKNFDRLINSSREGIKKPDPQIFELMTQKLDVKTFECIFIDDSEVNVTGANGTGMVGVLYKPELHQKFLETVNFLLAK